MTILPLHPADNASPEALHAFLAQCRAAAIKDGHAKLVSISLAVGALDPLAVLESIFVPGEPHFYAERPNIDTAIAGAEVAIAHDASGTRRFAAIQEFIDETLLHTIAVGDVEAPFGGPHFFSAFAFSAETEVGDSFPAARVFVPRWQVARAGAMTTAVANLLVTPEADLAMLAERVWRAHGKFSQFRYRESTTQPETHRPDFSTRETGDYRAVVARALARIAAGEFEKIVLARAIDLTLGQTLHPLRVLNGLRQLFPDCYAFSLANGRGQSFIGASPEQLVRVSKGTLETVALAGTTGRGASASDDATLALELLRNEKELREHRFVLETIAGRLTQLGLKPEYSSPPGLRRLANVQHLYTPVRTVLPESVRLLTIVGSLHPTPAVGGMPAAAAIARIRELEGFPRGLYAGAIGWVNARGGGEFFVGIRSALVDGSTARVYAGNGIVAGSTPEKEFAETELKFKAMLGALCA